MIELPESVQSSILSVFCDGKSILNYYIALKSNESLRSVALHMTRDALVGRYKNYANVDFAKDDEVRDVLDFVREEIRTYKVTKNNERIVIGEVGESKKISDWCAIVQYFDVMKSNTGENAGEFILWSGSLKTQQGLQLQNCKLSSKYWSVEAMDYLYNELELNNQYLCHPATEGLAPSIIESGAFAFLDVDSEDDAEYLDRINYSMSTDPDSARYILVPSQMEYDATMGFSVNQYFMDRKGFLFYWDGEDESDFDYSFQRLAENVKRILSRSVII